MNRILKTALIVSVLAQPVFAATSFAQSIVTPQSQTFDLAKIPGGAYRAESDHSQVFFEVNHLGFSAYIGFFRKLDANLNFDNADPAKSNLDVTIDAASIDAHNDDLTKNLRSEKFLDVAKYPDILFKSTKIEKTGDKTGKVTGDLTFHGVTKPVTLDVTFNGGAVNPVTKAYLLGFSGTARIKRSDFGVSAFLPMIGDDIALRIEMEFAKVP